MKCVECTHRFWYCVCAVCFAGTIVGLSVSDTGADEPPPVTDEIAPPRFLSAWGQEGTSDGQFQAPIGIAINAVDEVFITDALRNCVQRFTSDGQFLDKFDTGSFPGGIVIDGNGLIYVAVMMDHKISVFRPRSKMPADGEAASPYELVREWGKKGTGGGEFDQPGGLAFGIDGSLIVCDQVNHRVQRFTPEGGFLGAWGEYGAMPGQFGAPENPPNRVGGPCLTAVDREGHIYTTEPTAGRIQEFSPDGEYLASWGSNEPRVGAFGAGEKLKGPIALAFDRDGRLWVSATNHRVQLFTAEGRYLTGLGTTAVSGHDPGQFRTPHGMAFDSREVFYVVDTQNHRVQKFAFDSADTP